MNEVKQMRLHINLGTEIMKITTILLCDTFNILLWRI